MEDVPSAFVPAIFDVRHRFSLLFFFDRIASLRACECRDEITRSQATTRRHRCAAFLRTLRLNKRIVGVENCASHTSKNICALPPFSTGADEVVYTHAFEIRLRHAAMYNFPTSERKMQPRCVHRIEAAAVESRLREGERRRRVRVSHAKRRLNVEPDVKVSRREVSCYIFLSFSAHRRECVNIDDRRFRKRRVRGAQPILRISTHASRLHGLSM